MSNVNNLLWYQTNDTALPSFTLNVLQAESKTPEVMYALKFCAASLYGGGLDTVINSAKHQRWRAHISYYVAGSSSRLSILPRHAIVSGRPARGSERNRLCSRQRQIARHIRQAESSLHRGASQRNSPLEANWPNGYLFNVWCMSQPSPLLIITSRYSPCND